MLFTNITNAQQGMFNIKYSIGIPAADLSAIYFLMWAFSLRLEIGAVYQVYEGFAFKAAATYIHTFETPELGKQSYGTVDVGIVLSPTCRRILRLR